MFLLLKNLETLAMMRRYGLLQLRLFDNSTEPGGKNAEEELCCPFDRGQRNVACNSTGLCPGFCAERPRRGRSAQFRQRSGHPDCSARTFRRMQVERQV